jgi:hypothetical protein
MKHFRLLTVAALLVLSSCEKFVTHFSVPVDISQKDNVLINKGIFVKNIETEFMFQHEMDEEIAIENYSYLESLTRAIRRKGKVKGSEVIFDQIKEWNDLKDELIRVEDYSQLILKKAEVLKKVYEVFGVDYIISVQTQKGLAQRSFTARIISVKDNRLVFTLYFNADDDGFEEIVPGAEGLPHTRVNVTERNELGDEQFYYIRFANFLIGKMIAGGSK